MINHSDDTTNFSFRIGIESGEIGVNYLATGFVYYGVSYDVWYHLSVYAGKVYNDAMGNNFYGRLNGNATKVLDSGNDWFSYTFPSNNLCAMYSGAINWWTPATGFKPSICAVKAFKGEMQPGEIRAEMYSNTPVQWKRCIFNLPLDFSAFGTGAQFVNQRGFGGTIKVATS